jgi:hypothetical protein
MCGGLSWLTMGLQSAFFVEMVIKEFGLKPNSFITISTIVT